jgi:two-component system cell cycle response regulator
MTPVKILSVDDSQTIRGLIGRVFRPFECEILEAENGEEALSVISSNRPDLVILDYNMPVMDGISFLKQLRADPDLRRLAVIMLTADSSPEKISIVARLGVRDYLIKPFLDAELLSKAGRLVKLVPRVVS